MSTTLVAVCSRGTIVNESEEVGRYINNEIQPPLLEEYKNEFSIHVSIVNEDFRIEWETNKILVFINEILYLIMDMKNNMSYSKSIVKEGPYGKPIDEYKSE